ncbi:MAG: MotA/TolQ/ExbB proton channel family protein [Planctomycetota bacterium]|jgi:biopolymer transport protein ExbB/TolQ
MIEFFINGGIPMIVVNLFALLIALVTVERLHSLYIRKDFSSRNLAKRLMTIKFAGLAAGIVGILGTLLGLYVAFSRADAIIEKTGASPIYKVAKIAISTSIWGLTVAFLALIVYFVLKWKVEKLKLAETDSAI